MDIVQWDGELLQRIQNELHADWLTPIMKFLTYLGEAGIFWIAVCLLLLIIPKTRRLGIICSVALAFTFVCNNLIVKPLVDRERPWEVFEGIITLMPDPGDASFPSGHSANSMAPAWAMFITTMAVKINGRRSYEDVPCLGWKGAGTDARLMHRISIIAVILALLIGLSRLYLGMHFPIDVICGLLMGMVCSSAVYGIIRGIELKRGLIGAVKEDTPERVRFE